MESSFILNLFHHLLSLRLCVIYIWPQRHKDTKFCELGNWLIDDCLIIDYLNLFSSTEDLGILMNLADFDLMPQRHEGAKFYLSFVVCDLMLSLREGLGILS